jgi:3-phosphoshikimate 1-carboxyvinyltransferase
MSDAVVVHVPGDKSWSIRALLLTLVAEGPCVVRGVPRARITDATLQALRALGAEVDVDGAADAPVDVTVDVDAAAVANGASATSHTHQSSLTIRVTPPRRLNADVVVDCGGSATLARLLCGLLAGRGVAATIVGSPMLSRRPMRRVADPLAQWWGREVLATTEGRLPAHVRPGPPPPDDVTLHPGDSAQVRSAMLLAALATQRPITLWSKRPGRRHTEQLLRRLGSVVVEDDVGPHGRCRRTHLQPAPITAFDLTVPADPSAAAFVQVLAARGPRRVSIPGLIVDVERAGLLEVFRRAGVGVWLDHVNERDGLCTATVTVGPGHGTTPLPLHVEPELVPDLIDEVPVLAAWCAGASTPSTLGGLAELRVKESDRLARIIELLGAFGISTQLDGDTLQVIPHAPQPPSCVIITDHDHRIGMTAHVLARLGRAPKDALPFALDDDACIDESWPGFAHALSVAHRAIWQR